MNQPKQIDADKLKQKYNDMSYRIHRVKSKLGIYKVTEGVRNFWRYRKVIWQDRDFDAEFLFQLMERKLELMEEFFRSEDTHVADALQTADEIKETLELLRGRDQPMPETYRSTKIKERLEQGYSFEQVFNDKALRTEEEKEHDRRVDREHELKEKESLEKALDTIKEKHGGWWD